MLFVKPRFWVLLDDVEGADRHRVDLRFQFGAVQVTLGPETWARAIAASPLQQVAMYDAGKKGERPRVGPEATGGLLWHELVPS